jgi:hypothetical protein
VHVAERCGRDGDRERIPEPIEHSPCFGGVSITTSEWSTTVIMVSVFGDDSADETQQRVFAVAGVIATDDDWVQLESSWKERTKGVSFHATDCDSDQKDYATTPHSENKQLYRDLVHVLANSKAWGFGAALELSGFRDFFPPMAQELSYYKALFEVVRFLSHLAKTHFQDSVKFTFDCRVESNYPAGRLYNAMVNDPTMGGSHLFSEISFACAQEQPRIQIGDLLARETMKELDNRIGPVKRPRRKSMEALLDTRRFGIDLLLREYFEDMRQKTLELESKDAEFNSVKYGEWRAKFRLPDTPSNRYKFLAFVSSRHD